MQWAKELSCADSDTTTIDALKKGERGEERKVSKKEEKEYSSIDGRGLGASWAFFTAADAFNSTMDSR